MNPKLLLLFGIALLSAATSGSTVPPEKIPDEFSFYTEFKKFMGIYLEMKEIYFNFVSVFVFILIVCLHLYLNPAF